MIEEEKWKSDLDMINLFYSRQISKLVVNPTSIKRDVFAKVKTLIDEWEYEREKLQEKMKRRGGLNYDTAA